MRTRNWSIRSKIITMVAVPLTALLAVWLYATALTAGPAFDLLSARSLGDNVGTPSEVIIGELQRERRLSVQYVADSSASVNILTEQRAATDRAIQDFRNAARGGDAWRSSGDTLRTRIDQVFTELNVLAAQRQHIDKREVDPVGAQNLYNGMIAVSFDMFEATATFPDDEIDRQIRALVTLGRGQEYLSRVDALLAGATVNGRLTEDTRTALVQDIGTARFLLGQAIVDLPRSSRAAYQRFAAAPAYSQLDGMMNRLLAQTRVGQISPVGADNWHPAYEQTAEQLRDFENGAIDELAGRGASLAVTILLRLALAAVLGLFALVVSITVSVKVGRSMVGRLRRLRGEALEMATERLPNVVRRLQRGENVDVEVETPPLEYGKDEIGQLGHAFNDVQRTAVQSAVEEANVRRGLNEVFLNIARRSQTLLHRQLALLDRMERRETGPDELEDLYRVDHLATRMRRHAEDLVILAGAAPGRGWRNPVPVIDVIRGAISEVEDYKRIDIRTMESSAVLGRAVGDIIHLLAELLENATSFSPPHTQVQVTGQILPNGYAIEIEDRGLGMTHEATDQANRRLVEPPDFDPADSARLGLFVVAQLASRHGIRVSLRQSAYAGITAIVLIPGELVVGDPEQAALPAGASGERPLVGSGTEDGPSLAVLQWQGTEKLREVTVVGRPVGITAAPAPATGIGDAASVAAGVNADGLVQRRRVRRPVDLKTAAEPRPALPPAPAPVEAPATDDGLPKRIRQASLAPQLRRPAGTLPDEPTVPIRSPEQVRSIMSALQSGTTRGRIDASRYRTAATDHSSSDDRPKSEDRPKPAKPGNGGSPGGGSFADAATVSFPAIVNVAIARDAEPPEATPATGDRAGAPEHDHVTRPEKDAQ